jgi:pyridoxamine 5'-phosphate oxidase
MPPGVEPGSSPPADAIARLAAMRKVYSSAPLRRADLAPDPLTQFGAWLADVEAAGLPEPNAMVFATAAAAAPGEPGVAVPSARTVLLKQVDARGFVLFTNLGSRKGREARANPWASLVFPWFAILRQVVVVGQVEQVDRAESAAYFGTRPYGSRLGAWASRQSSVVASHEVLQERYAQLAAQYPDTGSPDDVPLPEFWGGLLVRPVSVEFWAGQVSRLHDRLRYRATSGRPAALDDPGAWTVERLSP